MSKEEISECMFAGTPMLDVRAYLRMESGEVIPVPHRRTHLSEIIVSVHTSEPIRSIMLNYSTP